MQPPNLSTPPTRFEEAKRVRPSILHQDGDGKLRRSGGGPCFVNNSSSDSAAVIGERLCGLVDERWLW